MRVLHIITGLSTGGAERSLYNVLAGGELQFGEHRVLSLSDEGTYGPRIRALGVPVFSLGMQRRGVVPRPMTVLRLRGLILDFQPDVIQGWMYHGNLAASMAGWLAPGRPAVAWNVRHSLYDLAGERPMTRQVIRVNRLLSGGADVILYNSRLSRRQHELFGFAAKHGLVIPNGFDLERLRPDLAQTTEVRQALGIPGSSRVVGHVARFHPMKDHALFLGAAVRLAEVCSDVRFLLVGGEVELNNPALVGIVPKSMENLFLCLGERQDVSVLMRAMDVFCLSSWTESFPNVLGEAMATGLVCVATDVGDSADILGNTGVIVQPRNEDALAQGLLAMLSLSEEERRVLGQFARTRIETNYALPRIVARYADLYERLTQGDK